jgi:hypothetical protein
MLLTPEEVRDGTFIQPRHEVGFLDRDAQRTREAGR